MSAVVVNRAQIFKSSGEILMEELGVLSIEDSLKRFLLVLLVALSVSTFSQLSSWFRRIPYTLLLVIVGLILAYAEVRLVELSPELILLVFLPPLLFQAAWDLEWVNLKRDWLPVALFAVIGVGISVAGTAFALVQFAGTSLAVALLLGASLSATDPVSVVALFRELGASKRLSTLVEGESLFNDGVAVVAFGLLVGFSQGDTQALSVQKILIGFITVGGIGAGVGLAVGFAISFLTQRFDLPLVEQSLTLVASYGAYVLADDLGGSGVIAVVIAGLVLGNFGSRIGMRPRTRLIVSEFWEFVAFFVNSIVFLLIGDQVRFPELLRTLPIIGITVVALLITRFVAVFGLTAVTNALKHERISVGKQTVIWWGGLRGSASIALALSVPTTVPGRVEIIAIVFGVVLFTLLVQGLTTQPLLEKLKLSGSNQGLAQRYLEIAARRVALSRVLERLESRAGCAGDDPELNQKVSARVREELTSLQMNLEALRSRYPELELVMADQMQDELTVIEAQTYNEYLNLGLLKDRPSPVVPTVFDDALGKQQH